MANELMGWGWDFAHMPYSDDWRCAYMLYEDRPDTIV